MKKLKNVITIGLIISLVFCGFNIISNRMGYQIDYKNLVTYAFNSKKIIDVDYLNQDEYPTGCESVTTVMALNYMGYDITIDTFIDKYLDISPMVKLNNELYGNNPNEFFIGNPREKSGFGCYAPVIYNAINKITDGKNVKNLTGTSFKTLCKDYIDNDIPVIVWATLDMQPSCKGKTWKLLDTENKTFTWISKEHCLLLVGYDNQCYYFNDPYNNNGLVSYDKTTVQLRYNELGSQAVAITE